MSLELRQGMRQEQRLALLPQMLQSIEVLQLATADLVLLVQTELQRNEALLVRDSDEPVPSAAAGAATADGADEPGFADWRRRASRDAGDQKLGFLANVPARGDSLVDHVREQLAFRGVPAVVADVVVQLAMQLDDRGLLPFADDDLARELDLPAELIAEARRQLCALEPRGIGAADPVAAMLLQAAGDPDLPAIERLLREHLDDLARNKLPEVARALQLSLDELQALIERVRELRPRPAADFHDQTPAPVRPDAFVWFEDGAVQVALDDRGVPELGLDPHYAGLAADRRTDREVRDYLKGKLRSARDLIEAVAQRHQTLGRVVRAVMQHQQAFLIKGRTAIRPLRMSDLAAELGLHTSTISRAIAGKYVQTDRGLFLLRDFFDGSRIEAAADEGQGRMAVAQRIAELVAAENKLAPLADDDIAARLAAQGVRVARRTIAKYRRELGIPSSYRRRRFEDPS